MAGYELSVGRDLLPGLLAGQDGLAKLVEAVLNQIPEAQVSEAPRADQQQPSAFTHCPPPKHRLLHERPRERGHHQSGDQHPDDRQPRRLLRLVEGVEQAAQLTDVLATTDLGPPSQHLLHFLGDLIDPGIPIPLDEVEDPAHDRPARQIAAEDQAAQCHEVGHRIHPLKQTEVLDRMRHE